MAINFPNSPVDGQIFGNYTYSADVPGWRKTPENAASLPAGTIVQWGAATAPANWLICDGSAVSRTAYSSLFAAIGVQFGTGNGTTTFNLPDLRGRVPVGRDAGQSEFDVLGETGGAKTHTLTVAEMPSHTHVYTNKYGNVNTGTTWAAMSNFNNAQAPTTSTLSTQASGDGEAHNNLQPYIVLNYIIKTSAGITSGDSELATRVGVVENQNNLTPMSYNYVINGAFDIWQRGVLSTSNNFGYFTADRWRHSRDVLTGLVQSVEQVALNGEIPELDAAYYVKRTVTTAGSCTLLTYANRVEDVRTLSNKTVTLSFWAKGSGDIRFSLSQNFGSGGSSTISYTSSDFTVTSSWMRYTFTSTLGSVAGKTIGDNSFLEATLQIINVSDGVNVSFAGVQLEEGSYATPFRRNQANTQGELAACQRYHIRFNIGGATGLIGAGSMYQPTIGRAVIPIPVTLRKKPVMSSSALSDFQVLTSGANVGIASMYIPTAELSTQFGSVSIEFTTSITLGGGAGITFGTRFNSSASAFIAFDSEL
jgi:microcystin-dependent protein